MLNIDFIYRRKAKMLLEFKVKNFRSFRDEAILSMVADNDKAHADTHLYSTGLKTIPSILPSAVIYGANASGKSNLLKAISFMKSIIAQSAATIQAGQSFNYQPFKLNNETSKQPIELEITFLKEGIRYQYGFKITDERIEEEWLLVYQTAKAQEWFTRRYNEETKQDEFKFSSHLKGDKKTWQSATRNNGLFLSTATQLNSEQLSPIFKWLVKDVTVITNNGTFSEDFSTAMLATSEGKTAIQSLLISADIPITDISIKKRDVKHLQIKFNPTTGENETIATKGEISTPHFHHETQYGSATFDLSEESDGTRKLFHFAGPILDILKQGRVLIVDELNDSLHPALVRKLVELFNDKKSNPLGAQLIFTTHDTNLLDIKLFRRDQIWFVKKGIDQESKLYPLTDFSPRTTEGLERAYLIGRYGALPRLEDALVTSK
jgi:hypothetical protein